MFRCYFVTCVKDLITKILRCNNNSFMTKDLKKEIMKRSKLKNSFNKNRNHVNWCKSKSQRNYFITNLLRKKNQNISKI